MSTDAMADVVCLGELLSDFVPTVTGKGLVDPRRARTELWYNHMRLLVVTEGAKGCTFFTRDFEGWADGFRVTAVDTTGADDGFVAGLARGLLQEPEVLQHRERLQDLCRFANAVGAIAAIGRGTIPSLLCKDRVLAFMAQQSSD